MGGAEGGTTAEDEDENEEDSLARQNLDETGQGWSNLVKPFKFGTRSAKCGISQG
jgi:hypothetical protein